MATIRDARQLVSRGVSAWDRDDFEGALQVFLGILDDGTRVPRSLDEVEAWVSCCDAVQILDSCVLSPTTAEVWSEVCETYTQRRS